MKTVQPHSLGLADLEHLAKGGATRHSLRADAGLIYRCAVCMNLDQSSPDERAAVDEAARAGPLRLCRNTMAKGAEQTEREYQPLTCWRV